MNVEFLLTIIDVLHAIVFIQAIILMCQRVIIDRDILIYISLTFIVNLGMKYNFDLFNLNSSKTVGYFMLMPSMIISKYYRINFVYLICFLCVLFIFLLSYFKMNLQGSIYFFGIGLLIYLIEVIKALKSNFSDTIMKIFIMLILTYNLFFLGLSNHPELWIASQFKSVIQIVFWGLLVLFYSYILYSHARIKY